MLQTINTKFKTLLKDLAGKDETGGSNVGGARKYTANMSWLFVGRVANIILSFAVSVVIARHLSPAGFGQINFVISFVSLFGFLATLGSDSIIVRNLVERPADAAKTLGTGLAIKIGGGLIGAISATVAICILSSSFDERLFVAVYSTSFIFQCLNIVDLYYQAKVISKRSVFAQLFGSTLSSIIKIFLVIAGAPVLYIIMAYVLETALIGLLLVVSWVKSHERVGDIHFDSNILKEILKVSWPLMLSTVASVIYARIDQVMIKGLLGNTDLGIYSSAVKLAEGWYFIPGIIVSSLFPALVSARANFTLYMKRLRWLYILLLVLSVSIAIGTTFLGGWIITLFYGPSYSAGALSLILYTWGGVGVFLGTGISQFLIAEGATRIMFVMTLFGAILNVLLNLALIPLYGINGSAFATFVSYMSTLVILLFFSTTRRHLKQIIWNRS